MILLDTHVLLWMESGNERLGANARQAIDRAWEVGEAAVSAISFWEVAMLESKGRLELKLYFHSWRRDLLQRGLVEVAVDGGTALRAGQLAGIHGDPADRLIIATALAGYQLEEIAHRIDEDELWTPPLHGLFETLGAKGQVEARLERVSLDATKTLRKALGLAMVATGANLRAASDRVPSAVSPLDSAFARHERPLRNQS